MKYIWVNRWEEFQSFQRKRGKSWAPPWIKLYPRLLVDDAFLNLTEREQLILVKLFMLFATTRGRIANDTRMLSRMLHQRVTDAQLKSLNHAGFISICSGTVLERRRNAFWNSSNLEVEEKRPDPPRAVRSTQDRASPADNGTASVFRIPATAIGGSR